MFKSHSLGNVSLHHFFTGSLHLFCTFSFFVFPFVFVFKTRFRNYHSAARTHFAANDSNDPILCGNSRWFSQDQFLVEPWSIQRKSDYDKIVFPFRRMWYWNLIDSTQSLFSCLIGTTSVINSTNSTPQIDSIKLRQSFPFHLLSAPNEYMFSLALYQVSVFVDHLRRLPLFEFYSFHRPDHGLWQQTLRENIGHLTVDKNLKRSRSLQQTFNRVLNRITDVHRLSVIRFHQCH